MNSPLPWSYAAMFWHVFRVPFTYDNVKTNTNTWKRVANFPVDIEQWCKDNLQGQWTWGNSEGGHSRPYFIESKSDAMLFKLVWNERVLKPTFREIG